MKSSKDMPIVSKAFITIITLQKFTLPETMILEAREWTLWLKKRLAGLEVIFRQMTSTLLKWYKTNSYRRLLSKLCTHVQHILISVKPFLEKKPFKIGIRSIQHSEQKCEIYSHRINISSIQLFSNFFMYLVKTSFSRNFCQKQCHIAVQCSLEKGEILSNQKYFVKSSL